MQLLHIYILTTLLIVIIMSLIKEAQQTCAFTLHVMKIQGNMYAIFTIRIYR